MIPIVGIEWVRHSMLPGLEVKRVHSSTHLIRMFSESHVVRLTRVSNGGEWRYRRFRYDFASNTYSMTEAGEAQWITKVFGPFSSDALLVEPQYLEAFAAELGIRGPIHFDQVQAAHPVVALALARLFARFDPSAERLELESLLVALFAALLPRHAERCAPLRDVQIGSRKLDGVRDQLIANFSEKVALAELAANVGLSRYHLLREFSREYGFPPHAFQLTIRVERARCLIADGMPLADVAGICGFADQSHLCRAFKKALGLAPGTYRAQAHSTLARTSI